MKKSLITIIVTILVIGSIPYVMSFSSYRSSSGYLGDGIAYATSDKSHYKSFRITYFHDSLMNRITSNKGDFYLDGKLLQNESQSFFVHEDATTKPIEFSITDYETSKDFSSSIVGILGPVPHFKDFQIEAPKDTVKSKLPN